MPASMLPWFVSSRPQQAHLPLDDFPEIRRWHAQLNALPAWREPFPELAEPAALAEAA